MGVLSGKNSVGQGPEARQHRPDGEARGRWGEHKRFVPARLGTLPVALGLSQVRTWKPSKAWEGA